MSLSLVEATIADLQQALSSSAITSVELLSRYLLRIFTYDCRGPCLNAIPILNPDCFDEAAASDARRRAGRLLGPLDGIPYTLKDSMKYKGMTCATGSPALKDLVANEDCFVAEQLRKAGAVCIGRTNTPPMMASGMHRGVYGRAESPYNLNYLTAAFSSGSSNGSGTSTAASFAAFGLGTETVSSGRSPASNNGLIALTPSRGLISPRGVWPLYPTCDVLVPHTRTVEDMTTILDVLTIQDRHPEQEFWRQQQFVKVREVERPRSYLELLPDSDKIFQGKRVAVPKMFIGGLDAKAKPTTVSTDVIDLWQRTRRDLESLGATVVESDFPLVTNYEDESETGHANNVKGFDPDWNSKERGELVAYMWDDFLKANGDPNCPDLGSVDGTQIFPRPEGYIPDRYLEHKNNMNYPRMPELARRRNGKSIWDIEGIATALPALEAQRKRDLEDWMDNNDYDVVVFPANGDVGKADLDTNDESARRALQNSVKYSNGNRAIRHMGVPTVSVTMGLLASSSMPCNLTLCGKHGQDSDLLKYAYAFEKQKKRRVTPPVTPALPTDEIAQPTSSTSSEVTADSSLNIEITSAQRTIGKAVQVTGRIDGVGQETVSIEAFIDGVPVPKNGIVKDGAHFTLSASFTPFEPPKALYGGPGLVVGNVNILFLVRAQGVVEGRLVTIPQK